MTGLLATIISVYWPFTGFEISANPVEEKRDPTLIRRSLIVMGIVASLYLLLNISLIGSVGAEALAASPAPVATAAGILFDNSGAFVAYIWDPGYALGKKRVHCRYFTFTAVYVI